MSSSTNFIELKAQKIAVLGESAVGKSSIVQRFARDHFHPYIESTIGASFFSKVVNIDQDSMKLDIWDTAGQERYHALAPLYYRSASGIIVVYDITNRESLETAEHWVREVHTTYKGAEIPIIYLVGNKIDLADRRQVSIADINAIKAKYNIGHLEVSAKTGINIIDLFHEIAHEIYKIQKKRLKTPPIKALISASPLITLEEDTQPRGWCC
jgi:small GTP-binding protein